MPVPKSFTFISFDYYKQYAELNVDNIEMYEYETAFYISYITISTVQLQCTRFLLWFALKGSNQ